MMMMWTTTTTTTRHSAWLPMTDGVSDPTRFSAVRWWRIVNYDPGIYNIHFE
jgi:hypothetical protein